MNNIIQIGCNYHTKWQSHSGMRFVLVDVKGDKAKLMTRKSKKEFWTNISDLIFIQSPYNIDKVRRLRENELTHGKKQMSMNHEENI